MIRTASTRTDEAVGSKAVNAFDGVDEEAPADELPALDNVPGASPRAISFCRLYASRFGLRKSSNYFVELVTGNFHSEVE